MCPGDPAAPELYPLETPELRLLHVLQQEIEHVRSFDRLMHVALRIVMPHFTATHGVVFAPERAGTSVRVVCQSGTRSWDQNAVRQILSAGRADVPPEI